MAVTLQPRMVMIRNGDKVEAGPLGATGILNQSKRTVLLTHELIAESNHIGRPQDQGQTRRARCADCPGSVEDYLMSKVALCAFLVARDAYRQCAQATLPATGPPVI